MLGPLLSVLLAAVAYGVLSAAGMPVVLAAFIAVIAFAVSLPLSRQRFGG